MHRDRESQECEKNPVTEDAVQELREHILRLDPTATAITPVSLVLAVASVNSTIR